MRMPTLGGRTVAITEARRATELATLIRKLGGVAYSAPAVREVPRRDLQPALAVLERICRNEVAAVIFLTGVGTRAVLELADTVQRRPALLEALRGLLVVARGPKPLAVLRELAVPVWVDVPEPNTWRELLHAVDAHRDEQPLQGARVALQEYGVSNPELLDELDRRGARVLRVPVYRWALPEDLTPLKNAVSAIAAGAVDVAIFTTSVQLVHLWQIVDEMHVEAQVRDGLARAVVGSIGPTTSEELRRRGLDVDLEASHPKFGLLVRELAERSAELRRAKRTAQD